MGKTPSYTVTSNHINITNAADQVQVNVSGEHDMLMAVIGILSFFSVIGTVGNALVLYVYTKKRNKLASTLFIITLAGTDFVTCLCIIPYTIVLEYMEYNVKYDPVCKIYMFLITSHVPFSAFIMMAIAVDRYLCICHPFTQVLKKRAAKVTILSLGIVAFSLGIITALNYGVYYRQKATTTPDDNQSNTNATLYIEKGISGLDGTFIDASSTATIIHIDLDNHLTPQRKEHIMTYKGICQPNGLIFSHSFTNIYQKVYSSFFVIVIVVVVILYILIYRFVSVRRAKRRRMRKQSSLYSSYKETPATNVNTRVSLLNGAVKTEVDLESIVFEEKPKTEKTEKVAFLRRMTIREKGLVANIRTAGMLFVVTAVFIVVFLPAWLMAHNVLPYNMLIFYMYFFYNVANPFIYAFMNKAFRRDLRDVIHCHASA